MDAVCSSPLRAQECLHRPTISERFENVGHSPDLVVIKKSESDCVDALFLGFLFRVRGVEALEKFGKTHDMDQFMGDDVRCKR